jgi:hypothetical protein
MHFTGFFTSTLLAAALVATMMPAAASAQEKYRNTYPMPVKVKPWDPIKVSPGAQVPDNQDAYTFVTTPSKSTGSEEIYVYYIDSNRKRARIGTVPAGTPVKMTSIVAVGKTIYYSIPWQNKVAWVSGYNIKASSYNPAVK